MYCEPHKEICEHVKGNILVLRLKSVISVHYIDIRSIQFVVIKVKKRKERKNQKIEHHLLFPTVLVMSLNRDSMLIILDPSEIASKAWTYKDL